MRSPAAHAVCLRPAGGRDARCQAPTPKGRPTTILIRSPEQATILLEGAVVAEQHARAGWYADPIRPGRPVSWDHSVDRRAGISQEPLDELTDRASQDAVAYFSENARQFDALYQTNPEFEQRLALWRALIDRYGSQATLTLDIGCGSGVMTFVAAVGGGLVIGVDGAAAMIRLCEERRRGEQLDNVRFVQGRLPNLDEHDLAGADLIICSSVLEYVEDIDSALSLLARLLRPGGTLLLSLPTLLSVSRTYKRVSHRLTGRFPIYGYIRHFTTPNRLSRRVARLGLVLQEAHYYDHHTRLAQLTSRMRLPQFATEDLFVAAFRKSCTACPSGPGEPLHKGLGGRRSS